MWYLKDAGVTLSGVLFGQRTVSFLRASPGWWKVLDVLCWFLEEENIGAKKYLGSCITVIRAPLALLNQLVL